ncbi:MAG: Asd/ArgC dimerization domain-containing protein [Thermoanaerobaculia bacterium]
MTRIAILDPLDLLGKEVCAGLERRTSWVSEVRLFTTTHEEEIPLTEYEGQPVMVRELAEGALDDIDLILACGPAARQRAALERRAPASTLVTLSPDAELADGLPVVSGVNDDAAQRGGQILSPAPGVVALAHLLAPLRDLAPTRAVATLIQPASTEGNAGLETLMAQTRSLLSFTDQPEANPFGGQLAFNLLPIATASHAADQLAAILGPTPPVAVTTLRGGIFHGVAISLWTHYATDPGAARIRDALASSVYVDLFESPAQLGPIVAAGREEVLCGGIDPDPRTPGAYWLWAAVDNLTRGGSLNALEIAESLFGADL